MSIKQLLSFCRIKEWLHVLGLPLLGLAYASSQDFSLRRGLLCLGVNALYLAHGYAVNEIFDTLGPAKNPSDNSWSKTRPDFVPALTAAFAILLVNLILASLLGAQTTAIVITGALLSYLYSGRPARLKEIPVVELFCNAAGFCLLFLLGYSAVAALNLKAIAMATLFLALFVPLQLIHELAHFGLDQEHKIHNTVTRYGLTKSVYTTIYSLALLWIWSIAVCLLAGLPFWLFLLSGIYCSVLAVKVYSCLPKIVSGLSANKLRIFARRLTVFYGAGIMLILLAFPAR